MAQAWLGQHVRPDSSSGHPRDRTASMIAVTHLTPGGDPGYGGDEALNQRPGAGVGLGSARASL